MPKFTRNEVIPSVFEARLEAYADERGSLVELFRHDDLMGIPYTIKFPQMGYISFTIPGMVRGPHEHRYQPDLFTFLGPGDFELHLWHGDLKLHTVMIVGESNPMAVFVPPGIIHGYKAISRHTPSVCMNFPGTLYRGWDKAGPVDEIRHEDDPNSPYRIVPGLVTEQEGEVEES